MTKKYEIVLRYIKDLSVEIPNVESFLLSREYITKYSLGLNITTNPISYKGIDISNNPNIECIDFENNQIINIVLNPNVTCLKLANNQLTSLDISGYGNLVNLDIRYNPLVCLNLANGNNQNFSLGLFEGHLSQSLPHLVHQNGAKLTLLGAI